LNSIKILLFKFNTYNVKIMHVFDWGLDEGLLIVSVFCLSDDEPAIRVILYEKIKFSLTHLAIKTFGVKISGAKPKIR